MLYDKKLPSLKDKIIEEEEARLEAEKKETLKNKRGKKITYTKGRKKGKNI